MALPADLQQRVEKTRAELAAMTADECLSCAALARSIKPILLNDDQRRIAEDAARDFEVRAAARTTA